MTAKVTPNPMRRPFLADPPDDAVGAFHARMPANSPTLLFDVAEFADRFEVGRVLVKAETRRMGLPSFKILGASWATYRALCTHLGYEPEPWRNINELAANIAHLRPFSLATATDGNHGRAVAFMSRLLGFDCHIFVPRGMAEARIQAIRAEGALVTVLNGTYDDAVARAAQEAGQRCLVISDTSWEGYVDTPARVIEGYTTIFDEVDDALAASGLAQPDVVVVPMGVGAFMAAAVTHYRSGRIVGSGLFDEPVVVGVEPLSANCVQASALAGELTLVAGPHDSIMVGLNCGIPSPVAWPRLSAGIDWLVSVDDDAARDAMRSFAGVGIVGGETGASALAGFEALLASAAWADAAIDLSAATVLLIITEGATDPDAYRAIVGRGQESVGRVLTIAR